MNKIFIKKVEINNYRCFNNKEIKFNIPDGKTLGSGLNIMIGENGNGKTTILESINYLTQSSYSTENKLNINDFNNINDEIAIKAFTNDYKCKLSFPYKGYFECNGFEFIAKPRNRKTPGKLLSSLFQVNNMFITKTLNYMNDDGFDSGKEIPSLNKLYSNSVIDNGEINIFYFDKNRSRQISTGNYKTTFERICDDLNWKFIKNIKDEETDELINNICGEYFEKVLRIAQKGVGTKIADDLKDFFDDELYKDLKIDLIEILKPYSNAFFAIRNDNDMKQIKTKELGSGIEIILTLLLLRSVAGSSKGSLIYLIDEPELHLHPKAQEKLIELLISESIDKQIIVTTHSPYIFKNCLHHNIGLQILKRSDTRKIDIIQATNDHWGVFPWSPSWGEINFHAFNLSTIEFHNELYGFLQEKSYNYTEKEIEEYFIKYGVKKTKKWIKVVKGVPQLPYDITLSSFIRNSIHHPENTENIKYSNQELNDSIKILIKLLKENDY